jgi:hypothetical protein
MSKGTDAEIKLRIIQVSKLIILGANYNDIAKYCKDKGSKDWAVTSSETVSKYIKRAKEYIVEQFTPEVKEMFSKQLARYEMHYRRASGIEPRKVIDDTGMIHNVLINDEDRAIKILSRIDKINCLETLKIEHTANDDLLDAIKQSQRPWYDDDKNIQTKPKTNNRKKNTT